ncbi:IclR family transcriptional regulator [Nocardioides immobilis]|uniref:IclR family transcriptional regulator n=1 Tax=Nocardioides immobilis TaxID=2049295 RepID=A0A417XS92_9ACTN|nr:IclR family transcriptional regulator [Nocardioides immobilis]RHW22738.1 IclR family transcriptional regulator [Nocardioides immobilis]
MAGNVQTPGASVSGRLLAVLGAFDVAHPAHSLTEISNRADLPLSTTKRLVVELERWGGLERLVNKHYRIGIRFWELGSLAPRQRGLRDHALPHMHDLYAATHQNVQLVVVDGLGALCIEKISGSKAVPTKTEIGGRPPLHATAVGKALLACSKVDLYRQVCQQGMPKYTPYTIVEPGRLSANLREVRRKGVAYSREEMSTGAISVASPIVTSDGVLRGALGVVMRANANLDVLGPGVRTAALRIARASG